MRGAETGAAGEIQTTFCRRPRAAVVSDLLAEYVQKIYDEKTPIVILS